MMVLDTVQVIRKGQYWLQWTLPTEFVLNGTNPPRPEQFTIMRGKRADLYQFEGEWLKYRELLDRHTDRGERFPGSAHFRQATELELWDDYGDDGHTEYTHADTYLVDASAGELALSGADISSVLRDAVEDYKKREEDK